MNIKSFAIGACVFALAACGNNSQDAAALKGANFISQQPGIDITLTFDPVEMQAAGRVVNLYHGAYTADGNKIKFGEMVSTMMMGPMEAMETEQEYFQFLPTVETYSLSDGRLVLKNADGKEMVFQQVDKLPDEDAQ